MVNAIIPSTLGIDAVPQFFLVKSVEAEKEILAQCATLIKRCWGSKTKLKWITPDECLLFDSMEISKSHVFVFPEFVGPAFDQLRRERTALLLGPSALKKCLRENVPIPNYPPPWIHNLAMKDLQISLSGFSLADKQRYTDLISFMGGLCLMNLPESTTHLVTNTVISVKYAMAVKLKIPIMTAEWIEEVWLMNQTEFVASTEEQFRKFRLAIFTNLNICTTQISTEEKLLIEQLVIKNGGTFHRDMKPKDIDILLLNKSGRSSQKFKAIMKYNASTTLLTPQWIMDSVKSEYALPYDGYRVSARVRGSTQKENNAETDFSIKGTCGNATINESVLSNRPKMTSTLGNIPEKPTKTQRQTDSDYYQDVIKNMTISNVEEAFLKDCNIYFSGFPEAVMTKLDQLVRVCGARRIENVDNNVTHVIVCKREERELKVFQDMKKGIHFVKFDWLKDSVERKVHANEEDYYCEWINPTHNKILLEQHPSPANKRNIATTRPLPKNNQSQLAAGSSKSTEAALPLSQNTLINKYLNSSPDKENEEQPKYNPTEKEEQNLIKSHESETLSKTFKEMKLFKGKFFAVQEAEDEQVRKDIRCLGGCVVDKLFTGKVDYLVTSPVPLVNFKPLHQAKEMVTDLWLEEVIYAQTLIPVEYYHRVVPVTNDKLLQGITITISTVGDCVERTYLTLVCQALGACVEETYDRRKLPLLICPWPVGSKYEAAINWEYPVVNKKWLLDTYERSCLYKVEDYLVGDSKLVAKYQQFIKLNERGIHKGTEPPPPMEDPEIIHILDSEESTMSLPNTKLTAPKRKSEEGDPLLNRTISGKKKKIKVLEDITLPPSNLSRLLSMNHSLRSASKTSPKIKASLTMKAPTLKNVPEKGQKFGYNSLNRKQLLKETNNLTQRKPHTKALQLHLDSKVSPGRQSELLHPFSAIVNKSKEKKSNNNEKSKTSTPLSELKRRFYQDTNCEELANRTDSIMFNINTQQLQVETSEESKGEEGAVNATNDNLDCTANSSADIHRLTDFIKKQKSQPKQEIELLQTCPMEFPDTGNRNSDIMVGWAETEEECPFDWSNVTKSMETNPFFQTSGISSKLINSMGEMIRDLKADMTNTEYDHRCTHLVCEKVARVQKVFCALAAGKWIVNSKYIEDSFKAKKFLKEEEYEWGNPKSKCDLLKLDKIQQGVARAAYSWRMKIGDPKLEKYRNGAFDGFVVMIFAAKVRDFEKVIEAGGGKVFGLNESLETSGELAKTVTHCFVEKKTPFPKKSQLFCEQNSIPVYDIQYLNEYLLNNEDKSRLQNFVLK